MKSLEDFVIENENITAKDYILKCARGFGALEHMKGESLDAEIRLHTVSNFNKNQIKKMQDALDVFNSKSAEELYEEYQKEMKDAQKIYDEKLAKYQAEKDKLIKLSKEVKKWKSPSHDHDRLREIAIKRLDKLIEDSTLRLALAKTENWNLSFEQWKEVLVSELTKHMQRYSIAYRKEKDSVEKQNKWIITLLDSFEDK